VAGPPVSADLDLVQITTVPLTLDVFLRGHIGYLRAHGFRVSAITSPDARVAEIARRDALPIYTVPMTRTIHPLADGVALARLWRLLRELRPAIVHAHTPKASLLGALAARAAGVPVVAVSIFGLAQMTRTGLTRRLLDATTRISTALADWVWCDSHSVRDHLVRERLAPSHKVSVLGHGSVKGVDAAHTFCPARFTAADRQRVRAHHGIPPHALVLGFVGRIVADKGMHELATAWRSLREGRPDVHLLLVGPFEAHDPLRPADDTLFRTDPRVHLAGMREDVAEHLAATDIFVMPSYREGFGVTNIEASALGLPVVSTRIPGCVDSVVDDVTGTLVPPRDPAALEGAIARYCDDAALRARHGQAGRARVLRDFEPETLYQALRQQYVRLVAGRVPALSRASTAREDRPRVR
jgi:glycosyltransferase involved in cell wall biosynthesis